MSHSIQPPDLRPNEPRGRLVYISKFEHSTELSLYMIASSRQEALRNLLASLVCGTKLLQNLSGDRG